MKSAEVLIVGQGLAGTVLGWSLTRAGIEWRMIDAGHERAASRVAAGIINPVTGQRWVKTWRIEELWPETRTAYLSIEQELGVTLLPVDLRLLMLHLRRFLEVWAEKFPKMFKS